MSRKVIYSESTGSQDETEEMDTHKLRGFTLIELLVVITIIALLLSILVPGLQKAKQYVRRVVYMTNLHSYGLAGEAYLAENRTEGDELAKAEKYLNWLKEQVVFIGQKSRLHNE